MRTVGSPGNDADSGGVQRGNKSRVDMMEIGKTPARANLSRIFGQIDNFAGDCEAERKGDLSAGELRDHGMIERGDDDVLPRADFREERILPPAPLDLQHHRAAVREPGQITNVLN